MRTGTTTISRALEKDGALMSSGIGEKENANFGETPPNGSRSVSFKPLFGLFNQFKYIPLTRSPLTLEFEVVNGALDAIMGTNAAADYTDANTSKIWQKNRV